MLFFAYFLLALVLSLYQGLLFFAGKQRFLAVLKAFCFLLPALPLTVTVYLELSDSWPIKTALASILVGYCLYIRLNRANSAPKPTFFGKNAFWVAAFFMIGGILCGINAIQTVMNEKPVLCIELTGKSEMQEMEWKMPDQPLQKSMICCHEVILRTPDKKEIVLQRFLNGDICAVRAKIFRFHPLLSALGISNKYHLDIVYTGYRKVENYAKYPIKALTIPFSNTFFRSLTLKYWESIFSLTATSYWVKSANLESNYFPLIDEKGNAVRGEFFLTLTNSGLSAVARRD